MDVVDEEEDGVAVWWFDHFVWSKNVDIVLRTSVIRRGSIGFVFDDDDDEDEVAVKTKLNKVVKSRVDSLIHTWCFCVDEEDNK